MTGKGSHRVGGFQALPLWIETILNYSLSVPEIYHYTYIFPLFSCFLNHYNRR